MHVFCLSRLYNTLLYSVYVVDATSQCTALLFTIRQAQRCGSLKATKELRHEIRV